MGSWLFPLIGIAAGLAPVAIGLVLHTLFYES